MPSHSIPLPFQLPPAGDNNHNATEWRTQWPRTHAHHGCLAQRERQLRVCPTWGLRPAQGFTVDPGHAGVTLELNSSRGVASSQLHRTEITGSQRCRSAAQR